MRLKHSLLATATAGLLVGAVVFRPQPAYADWPVFDIVTHELLNQLQSAVTSGLKQVSSDITGMQTSLTNLLTQGFTQEANYQKAQVGAMEQITDASNQINSIQRRQILDSQIMANHTVTPQACDSLTNGQSTVAANLQVEGITAAIEDVTDPRGEAAPQTPSYASTTQGVQAANDAHYQGYCSANDEAAGLCSGASNIPDGDEQASSLLGIGTYSGQSGLNTANAYATTLIQPVAPAAIRGTQLTSLGGQSYAVWRRHYNAEMSLARRVVSHIIATRTPSVYLTTAQQQEMVDEGLPQASVASWLEALSLDVNRRESNVSWHAALEADPNSKAVLVEIATEIAQSNYIALRRYEQNQRIEMLDAARLADKAQHQLPPSPSVPIPSVASN